MVEHSRGGDHHVDDIVYAERGLEVPTVVHEVTPDHLFAEADGLRYAMGGGDPFKVGEDLGAGREAVAPFGVRGEGVGVERRRDVARHPRVRVGPPGATEAVGLLVDRDVGVAVLPELDRGQDSRHAGADHGEAEVPSARCQAHLGRVHGGDGHGGQ